MVNNPADGPHLSTATPNHLPQYPLPNAIFLCAALFTPSIYTSTSCAEDHITITAMIT